MSNTTSHTGHPKKHLPESHLRLSGQGLKLAGQGGTHLQRLAQIGHKMAKTHHGKLGAVILHAIGHVANSKAKNKRHAFGKKVIQLLKKHHFPQHAHEEIHKIVHQFKHRPIGIKDIFGKDGIKHGKQMIDSLASGGSFFGAIGKAVKKGYKGVKHVRDAAFHKLRQFADGKTKFKPSQLANYLAGAVGIAGAASAFIPGVDLISVPAAGAVSLGLKSVGTVLKTSGRGMGLPSKIKKYVQNHPKEAKRVLAIFKKEANRIKHKKGGGKKINIALGTAGAIMLFGFLKDNAGNIGNIGRAIGQAVTGSGPVPKAPKGAGCGPKESKGAGLTVAGAGFPERIKQYMKEHPTVCKKIAKKVKAGGISGGSAGKFTAALGLAGTSAAAGAYGMYKYLMANPSVAAKIAAKGVGGILGAYMKGGTLYAGAGNAHASKKGGCRCIKKPIGAGKKGGCKCIRPMGKGLTVAGAGDALQWGVSRLPSGKVKKDRYSVYYGYYNKTGSGLTKDAFGLKGRKVVSKRRQQLGRKNMNFRRKPK